MAAGAKEKMEISDDRSVAAESVSSRFSTTLTAKTLKQFVEHANPCGSVKDVPGIKEKNAEILAKHNIKNTHQLIGKFIILKNNSDMNVDDHCASFESWLKEIGIKTHTKNITCAIAEKTAVLFPDLHP